MRLIKSYLFKIGTKIPYSNLPEIVHRFLSDNSLTSKRFLYYFEDSLFSNETPESKLKNCGCTRILKDCPSLGDIRYHNGKAHRRADILWLSNIDKTDSFNEEAILPLMKKIHRRYGFSESALYYFDIDFFGKRIPFERDYSDAQRICKADKIQFDPSLYMAYQPYGSGITLHRDACSDNYLELSVDIMHDGTVLDAAPYYDAMQKLLPNIKVSTYLKIYLTEKEKQNIEEINQAAAPVLEQCRDFFGQRLLSIASQNNFSSNYSIAKPLKKLAKQYGYTYHLVWNGGTYSLKKRTSRGNVIYIDVDSGPSHYDLSVGISYQGVGFNHKLGRSFQTPTTQSEVDIILEQIICTVSEFENTLLPSLDILYPETPNWFIPSEF